MQFEELNGFQSVGCSFRMSFDVQNNFIQILHDKNHWLTISTVETDESDVYVYDSLYRQLSDKVQSQIACIMKTPFRQINAHFIDIQRQSGTSDCGVFAIAFATSLCFGQQPELLSYNQPLMRQHLMKCFEAGKMELFPIARSRRLKSTKITNTQHIKVYCICRMPEMDEAPMIECSKCKQWYHTNICIKVPKEAWESKMAWLCTNCQPVIKD